MQLVGRWDQPWGSGQDFTIDQLVVGAQDALVKGARIGGRLKCESVPLLPCAPMMKCGHYFVILQISIDHTAQNDLPGIKPLILYYMKRMLFVSTHALIGYPLPVDDVVMTRCQWG